MILQRSARDYSLAWTAVPASVQDVRRESCAHLLRFEIAGGFVRDHEETV